MGLDKFPIFGLMPPNALRKAAIFAYQFALLYRFDHDLELCVDLKAYRTRDLMMYDQASLSCPGALAIVQST